MHKWENIPTRSDLVARLRAHDDAGAWNEFVSTYGCLIQRLAKSKGLAGTSATALPLAARQSGRCGSSSPIPFLPAPNCERHYEVRIGKGFSELKPSAYTASAADPVLNYRQPVVVDTDVRVPIGISIEDISIVEGNSGTTNAVFNIRLV